MALAAGWRQAAPCNDPPTVPADRRGALINHLNPDPGRGAGSRPRKQRTSMDNPIARGAGGCLAHRTHALVHPPTLRRGLA